MTLRERGMIRADYLNRLPVAAALAVNKHELVRAHRAGDWVKAARLSRFREQLKRRRRRYGKCEVCKVTVAKQSRRCFLHRRFVVKRKQMGM